MQITQGDSFTNLENRKNNQNSIHENEFNENKNVYYNDKIEFSGNENKKNTIKENYHYSHSDDNENERNENKIKLLEMQLKAIENLFSLQERILAENGLKASLEGNNLQNLQNQQNAKIYETKNINEEGKMMRKTEKKEEYENKNNEKSITPVSDNQKKNKIKKIENIENIENTENTGIADKKIFKSLRAECFPYVRLLELWRKKCFCSVVERMRSEKVKNCSIIYSLSFLLSLLKGTLITFTVFKIGKTVALTDLQEWCMR